VLTSEYIIFFFNLYALVNLPVGFIFIRRIRLVPRLLSGQSAGDSVSSSLGDELLQHDKEHMSRKLSDTNVSVASAFEVVQTIAGSYGNGGILAGDYGAATSASLSFPQGITMSNTGNIYIADTFNNVVRQLKSQKIQKTRSVDLIITTLGAGVYEPAQPTPAPVEYYYSGSNTYYAGG
jgi:NHL repeat